MRVSFSQLTDSQDDGASARDAMGRLMMYMAEGGSKRRPLGRSAADEVPVWAPESNRFCVVTRHSIDIDRPKIVARAIGEESQPQLGLALILRKDQGKSFVGEMQMCLDRRRGIRKWDSTLRSRRCSLRPQEVRGKHQKADQQKSKPRMGFPSLRLWRGPASFFQSQRFKVGGSACAMIFVVTRNIHRFRTC